MFHRIALLAAVSTLAAACASNPSAGSSISADAGGAVPLAGAGSATIVVQNLAGNTAWLAEDNLIPQDPVLALVNAIGGNTDNPQGVVVTCNAANGGTTMKIGKQPANRVGQSATLRRQHYSAGVPLK
jgi:hypothetical protein